MKYIIFKDNVSGLFQPVIFGEHTTHSSVKIDRATPVSAGFVYIQKGNLMTTGKSDSLKLSSMQEDVRLLELIMMDAGTAFFISEI